MADISQDDFKWFGEGFDGFPKRLPEDVVEYLVFIIDAKLTDIKIRERLQAFQRALSELEKKFLKEYIWQREGIRLELVHEQDSWLLRGRTNYGDSVADEWLIVYFLRELSKQFPDAWIRIYDTDGEFLLIEAANALPKWLTPEVAENRVWINDHQLRVVPFQTGSNPKSLSLREALDIIKSEPNVAKRLEDVEKEAFHRLSNYPKAISENQHHASLPLPRKLAFILHQNPSYISPAVEAFYLRDPVALRVLQPKTNDKSLRFPPEDWVNVSVRFTRVLFAQLRSQEWVPLGPYGDALALLSNSKSGARDAEKAGIGVKLAAGFEMLIQDKMNKDRKAVREIELMLEDIDSGEETLPTDAEIEAWGKRDDDESWLDINFEDFERELAGKGKNADVPDGAGFGDKAAQENLRKMVERMETFLKDDEAGLEGAEGLDLDPMDFDNDDEPSDDDSDTSDEEEGQDGEDDFDEEEFTRLMHEIMRLSAPEKAALTEEARELANELESSDEEDDAEAEEIRKLSEKMEAELNGHGALDIDPSPRRIAATRRALSALKESDQTNGNGKGKGKQRAAVVEEEDESSEDEDVLDVDYNLAKNMLESLKGQAGMAGPAGNLMGLLGVNFPRDEGDD